MKPNVKKCFTFFLCSISFYAYGQDPWFTGPLLAAAGHTIPAGHSNLEVYGSYTKNEGIYQRHWKVLHTPGNHNASINPLFSHGLTPRFDVQFSFPVTRNVNEGQHSSGLTDSSATLGFQLLEQNHRLWHPDLRLSIQQIFPSGRYEHLNPEKKGTDATGLGSYRTDLGFNFQHLQEIVDHHYLRTRLSLNYQYASPVKISGLSSYGGSVDTYGTVKPGHHASIDIAGELTLTQHWVLVMEGLAVKREATSFTGSPGITPAGVPAAIGHQAITDVSLAPAIEYNLNAHFGIIAGVWFSLPENNSVKFLSSVIALNAYW